MSARPLTPTCFALAAAVCLAPALAHAEPIFGTDDVPEDRGKSPEQIAKRDEWRPGFGARVGGYGFRRTDDGSGKWDDCRMNGFGVFGTLDANRYLFGELGVDFYQATPEVTESGMDRVSTHTLAAVGLRMFPKFVITPYVQLGVGAEYTRIDLGGGRTEKLYPMTFVGIGTEINVTRELKLGANIRALGTMRPSDETPGQSTGIALTRQALTTGESNESPSTRFDLAAQGQFFARYAL